MKKYVSIDIGGTAIKYGLVNEKGEILESSQMKTEAHKGGPSILEKAVKIVKTMCRGKLFVESAFLRLVWWMWKKVKFFILRL